MKMPWEDDINWGNTATTVVKGEPMKTELVYCDLTDCIYHENSKEEYHSIMSEPAPPICRLREIRLVGGQCCEYDEAERRADETQP